MAGNKPPRKSRNARNFRKVPMTRETHDRLATQLHGNVCSLIEAPNVTAWNAVMQKVEAVTISTSFLRGRTLGRDRDSLTNALRTILYTMQAIGDRDDSNGAMNVTEAEASSLRMTAVIIDEALPTIPVNVYQASGQEANRQQIATHAQKMAALHKLAA